MPKKNRKGGKQSGGGSATAALLKLPGMGSRQNTDDERDTLENWSTNSNASEDGSVQSSVESGEVDDTSAQEQLEDQLTECIDNLSHKSAQVRKANLCRLHNVLQLKYLKDYLDDRKETVLDALEKCIRRGKGDEQAQAALCLSALLAQMGNEMAKALESVHTQLTTLVQDNSASIKAREECCKTLAFIGFITNGDATEVEDSLATLAKVFKSSLPPVGGTPSSLSPEMCGLVARALESWCLLLTQAPASLLQQCRETYLNKIVGLLRSSSIDLRISGGEAIALMYELTRVYHDENFEGDIYGELVELLRQLSTDSQKHRSKKDRRVQRASFRDILHSIEEGYPAGSEIKFGQEALYLGSWAERLHYQTFCDVMGPGINIHLKENELIREVFSLGDPLPPGVKAEKLSKAQRNMINKERGRLRARQRDKRTYPANGF